MCILHTTPYLSPNSLSNLCAVGERGEEGVLPAWTGSLRSVLLSQLEGGGGKEGVGGREGEREGGGREGGRRDNMRSIVCGLQCTRF